MKKVALGRHTADPDNPPIIVAEAGFNHNGDSGLAVDLIHAAAEAGAGMIKFQTFRAEDIALPSAPCFGMLKENELDYDAYPRLFEEAEKAGITLFSTPLSIEAARFLVDLGMKVIKVASMDLDNLPFLKELAELERPLVVSTGMATIEETDRTVEHLEGLGADFILLHCVSEYPAPIERLNLGTIPFLAERYGVPVGFSDHSEGLVAPALAAAAGAVMIEKHFTLDKALPGPDHAISLDSPELARMVREVREAWRARGRPKKEPTAAETASRGAARRGVYAARDIAEGETITREKVKLVRPQEGAPAPSMLDELLGTTSPGLSKDSPIIPALRRNEWVHHPVPSHPDDPTLG